MTPPTNRRSVRAAVDDLEADGETTRDPSTAPPNAALAVVRGWNRDGVAAERERADAVADRLHAADLGPDGDADLGHGWVTLNGRTLASAGMLGPAAVERLYERDVRPLKHSESEAYAVAVLVPEGATTDPTSGDRDPGGSTGEDDPGTAA